MGDECSKLVTITSDCHHAILVKALFEFFGSQHGVDYDFRFGGRSIPAHKIILDVFLPTQLPKQTDSMAAGNWDGLKIKLNQSDDRDPLLDAILEFMYTGTVTVRYGQMEKLLEMAKEMGFRMLVEAIEELKIRQILATKLAKGKAANCADNGLGDSDSIVNRLRPIKSRTESEATRTRLPVEDDGSDLTLTESEESEKSSEDELDDSGRDECQEEDENEEDEDEIEDDDMDDDDWKPRNAIRHTPPPAAVPEPKRSAARNRRLPPPSPLECGHCDFKTWSNLNFGLHQAEHDSSVVVYKCEQCSQRYLTETDLSSHQQLLHPGPRPLLQCPHCDYRIRSTFSFQVHMAKHDPSIQVLRCLYCSRYFLSDEALQKHVATHKPYKCPRCDDFETLKLWTFHKHLFSAHQLNAKLQPAKRLCCPDCKFTCQKRSELKYHKLAMHSGGVKPYKCPHCDYATARRNEIARHVKIIHLNIKKHLCDTCGYRTVSQSALAQHKQKHSNLRPHVCPQCGKGYNDKGTLRHHLRVVHEKDGKPFVCHVCARAFGRRDHLRTHLVKAHDVVELSAT